MPRLLFYVVLTVIAVLLLQRLARARARNAATAPDPHMPKTLVCGACGSVYDPQKSGWLCPQCHK